MVRVDPTGKVFATISQAGAGQGHLTTFAQLVADEVGVRIEDVTIVEGDTAMTPYGTGTVASRSAIAAGGAVIKASRQLVAKLKRLAADRLEADADDIVIAGGRAHIAGVPDLSIDFEQLARWSYGFGPPLPAGEQHGLEVTDVYDLPMVTIANAVHVAMVAVDPRDATVTIEKYVVVHDCGRVINPMIVDGQSTAASFKASAACLWRNSSTTTKGR